MQKKSTVNDLPAVVPDCLVAPGRLKKAGLLFTIMKVTLIQITVAMMFCGVSIAFDTYAQEVLKRKVSLELKDVSLMEALGKIEEAANVKFVYSPARINLDENVSLEFSRRKLGSLLSELLTPRAIKFKVQEGDDYIILVEDEKVDFSWLQVEDPLKSDVILANVSGMVSDEGGNPLPGVNIIEKGTTNGTTTDAEGKYTLAVLEEDAVLVFSFIGYITREVAVNGRSVVDVTMMEDVQSLDEVVVVGYGTQKKENLTGAISNITSEDIQTTTHTSLAQSLQGKISGLQIRQHSGAPGDVATAINIRGFGAPLYVIDGIARDGGNEFQRLNPEDIESISVLKDASAAIYGLNAANGVIIVTTKKGAKRPPVFQYNGVVGVQSPTDMPEIFFA